MNAPPSRTLGEGGRRPVAHRQRQFRRELVAGAITLILATVAVGSNPPRASADSPADLSVSVTRSTVAVYVRTSFAYTVSVANQGPQQADGVSLTEALPANVQLTSATSSLGTCTMAGSSVTCDLGSIPSGATATVTLSVTATAPGTITDTAQVATILERSESEVVGETWAVSLKVPGAVVVTDRVSVAVAPEGIEQRSQVRDEPAL